MGTWGQRARSAKAAAGSSCSGWVCRAQNATETPRDGSGWGRIPRFLIFVQTPCLSLPFTEGSWANRVPVGEAESGWAVRMLRSHPRSPTLQDLWVLVLRLGTFRLLKSPMGSVSLLPSWPQDSGDPVSEPATRHHVFQTLKSCAPPASSPRGGTGLREVY